MTSAHERKKQPEAVRRRLLDCAARLATAMGLSRLTLRAVAEAAGVTKGGLLHHFPSKQKLTEALCSDLLSTLDREIDEALARDSEAYGRFTRAYLWVVYRPQPQAQVDPWAALSISLLTDPALRRIWGEWLHARLERHRDTDSDPALQLVRYAADGVWLAELMGPDGERPRQREALFARLLDLTKER